MRILHLPFCLVALALSATAASPGARQLYMDNCAACHGMDGSGGIGPDLRGNLRHCSDVKAISAVIKNGIPDTQMPAFASLTGSQRAELARYVQQFRHRAQARARKNVARAR